MATPSETIETIKVGGLEVMPGVLAGARDRPTLLRRHPDGVEGESFYQKRVPSSSKRKGPTA